ncbi:MAG: GNAT family N-acetyltransferase [Acidimicrobiia bacterium]
MAPSIRPLDDHDIEAVVQLSLRAWAPNFASLEQVMRADIYERLHPDWQVDQRRDVEAACAAHDGQAWVAKVDGSIGGFVVVELHEQQRLGEIFMLAVDPDHQRSGVGAALTEFALGWMKGEGMTVAMVETGGDPGHAPARRTYEQAGFELLPISRYFKPL